MFRIRSIGAEKALPLGSQLACLPWARLRRRFQCLMWPAFISTPSSVLVDVTDLSPYPNISYLLYHNDSDCTHGNNGFVAYRPVARSNYYLQWTSSVRVISCVMMSLSVVLGLPAAYCQ